MSEAQKRAQARRAKILARGGDGLAQLAKTARGEEGATLYDTTVPPAKPASKGPDVSGPSTSSAGPAFASSGMESPEAYQAQMENMMRMLGGGDTGGMPGMPDMSALQAMLGGPGMNTSQDNHGFPSLLQGPGASSSDLPPMNSPFPTIPGMNFNTPGLPARKPLIERFFPVFHALATICLFAFVTLWWEPAVHTTRNGQLTTETSSQRWRSLLGSSTLSRNGATDCATEALPVFWAFTTVQLLLQTTRFLVFRSPPAPHSLLQNFLPFLPPAISMPLLTGSRYLSLIAQTWKDGCLFIALLGLRIAIAAAGK